MKSAAVLLCLFSLTAASAYAETEAEFLFERQDSCVTGKFFPPHARPTCDGSVCFTAPEGSYIRPNSYTVETVDERGSGSGCGAPYVAGLQVIGDAFLAKTVCANFNARSSGDIGTSGRIECRLKGIQKTP